MDLKTHIGLRVKAARTDKGLTQDQLAAALGKAVETISNIERGQALTGLATLERIAVLLDVPLLRFFDGLDGSRAHASRRRVEAELSITESCRRLDDGDVEVVAALVRAFAVQRGR
jgi:transcriptional regulator with XRE-family HTH domain